METSQSTASNQSVSRYGTITFENNTSITLELLVVDPDGIEHLITKLEPGQITVQFSPLGATWTARPEVPEMQYFVKTSSDAYKIDPESAKKYGKIKDRGDSRITSIGDTAGGASSTDGDSRIT